MTAVPPVALSIPILESRMAGRKIDLINLIATRHGLPAPVAQAALQAFLDVFIESLATEGRLELREFGVFRVCERKPMLGRNPRTGEAVALPRRRFVTFRMGRVMRERVWESGGRKSKASGRMSA